MDRETLQAILDSNFALPEGKSLDQLTTELEALLGSTDKFLRENSLEVLWSWAQAGHYTDVQLIDLGERMAANLAVGLGETGTDTVFIRAFSALALAAVVIVDQRFDAGQVEGRAVFVGRERTRSWFEHTLACFVGECDRRGYVKGKGWAHAIAHEADVLSDFARSPHLDAEDLERILVAVADKMIEPADDVLRFEEDNRLTQMVLDVLRRNLVSVDAVNRWLDRLAHPADGGHWADVFGLEKNDERGNSARLNTRAFLRSLYFQLSVGSRNFRAGYLPEAYARPIEGKEDLLPAIVGALKTMDRYFFEREDGS